MLPRESAQVSHTLSYFAAFDLSVYEAENPSDATPLLAYHYHSSDFAVLQQLQQSWEFVQGCSHRHLGKVAEVRRLEDGELVVYTESLQQTVQEWVQAYECCPWSVDGAFQQIAGLIEVLAEAQRNKVLHRRLSPEHIYYDSSSELIKLLDFSPCSLEPDDDRRFVQKLPPKYRSPERNTPQWQCSLQSAAKADVYSLGILALELIYRGVAGEQTTGVLLAGLRDYQQLHNLLEQMLTEDPRKRPDFLRLQSHLKGEPEVPVAEVKPPVRIPSRPPPALPHPPPGKASVPPYAKGGSKPPDNTCPHCGEEFRLDLERSRGICRKCYTAKGSEESKSSLSSSSASTSSSATPNRQIPPPPPFIHSQDPEVPKSVPNPPQTLQKVGPRPLPVPTPVEESNPLPVPAPVKESNPLTVQAAQEKQSAGLFTSTTKITSRPLPVPSKPVPPPAEEKKQETVPGEEKRTEGEVAKQPPLDPGKPIVPHQFSQPSGKIGPRPLPGAPAVAKPDQLGSSRAQSRCKKCGNLFESSPSPWRDKFVSQRPMEAAEIQRYCSETCLPEAFKQPPGPVPPAESPSVQPKPMPPKVAPVSSPSAPPVASDPVGQGGPRPAELFSGNPQLMKLLGGRVANPGIPGNPAGIPAGEEVPGGLPGMGQGGVPGRGFIPGMGGGMGGGFPGGMGRGFPQGGMSGRAQAPGIQSRCIVCMREFVAPKPAGDAYSAYYISFCGEECQLKYYSLMGDESTITQAIESQQACCMQCRSELQESSGVILPCNASHKFCSNSCGKAYLDSVFSKSPEGSRDLDFLICPRCEMPIPTEMSQQWLSEAAAPRQGFPPPVAKPQTPGCDGCQKPTARMTSCVHWLCEECAARSPTSTGFICPKCKREARFQ